MDFDLQSCIVACEANKSMLTPFLSHDCPSKAWPMCWRWHTQLLCPWTRVQRRGCNLGCCCCHLSLVFMCGVRLVGVAALQSCAACCLQRLLHLDELAGKVVGLTPAAWAGLPVGTMVVATRGTLMGLHVGLLVGIIRTGDCGCMERVICLLSSIRGLGTLGGAFIGKRWWHSSYSWSICLN